MIIEGVTCLAFWVVGLLFEGLQVVSLPVNLATVLIDFMKIGAWILGADLLGIVFATVSFWLTFKLAAGLILFIWRLLPLT